MQVDTVYIAVPSIEVALEFYEGVLGLTAGPRFDDWQVIRTEGSTVFALHGGLEPVGGQRTVVSLRVTDLDAEASRIRSLGHEPLEAVPVDTGAARFHTWVDPWGTELQLIER